MSELDAALPDDEIGALRRRCDLAEQRERARTKLLATVSHELREPMNAIIGMARLLLDTPLSDEQQEYGEAIMDGGEALLTVVNDLLDASRIDAGQFELADIDFDLPGLIERIRALLAQGAGARGLVLRCRMSGVTSPILRGDPGRLRQILTNLLGNAIKFTEGGEVSLHIDVQEAGAGDVRVVIEVSDTGIGIASEAQERIFEPFGQADTTIAGRYGGTGLGLAISRQLVELMGGTIGVTSQPGQGACFRIELPFARGEEPARDAHAGVRLKGRSLLVAMAQKVARDGLVRQARAWGMKVHGVDTARDALAFMDGADGDLALALIGRSLPDLDGELLGQRILAHRHGRNAAMALLAPSGLRGDAERVRETGFAAYLNGTPGGAALLACLNEMLRPGRAGLITVHSLSEASERSLDVLLADDNVLNRRLAAILLEQAGHRVEAVADGREAVDAVRGKRFDVVLMDVRMPVLGGLDATAEIRRLPPPACAVPVIAITASGMHTNAEICRAAGMNDYITKPIDRATLMDRVTRWGQATEAGTA